MTETFKLKITNDERNEIAYHEKLKQIAIYTYQEPGSTLPDGFF